MVTLLRDATAKHTHVILLLTFHLGLAAVPLPAQMVTSLRSFSYATYYVYWHTGKIPDFELCF